MADAVPPHKDVFRDFDARPVVPACLTAGLINDRQHDECFHDYVSILCEYILDVN